MAVGNLPLHAPPRHRLDQRPERRGRRPGRKEAHAEARRIHRLDLVAGVHVDDPNLTVEYAQKTVGDPRAVR